MFTADGSLREEYKEIEAQRPKVEEAVAQQPAAEAPSVQAEEVSRPGPRPVPEAPLAEGPAAEESRPADGQGDGAEEGEGKPGFMDLLGLLAQHASVYLRQGGAGMGMESTQSLELAKLHIDLLSVLQEKTEGNLNAEERAALEEVLYQLRMGFVQVGG